MEDFITGLSELIAALGNLSPLALAAAIILGTFGFIAWLPRVFSQRTKEAEERIVPQSIGNSIAIMLEDRAAMERLIREVSDVRDEAEKHTKLLEEILACQPRRRRA